MNEFNQFLIFVFPLGTMLLSLSLSLIRKHEKKQAVFLNILAALFLFYIIKDQNIFFQNLFFSLLTLQLIQLSLEDLKSRSVHFFELLLLAPTLTVFLFFQERTLSSLIIPFGTGFLLIFLPYLLSRFKGLGAADVIIFSGLSLTLSGFEPVLFELFSALSALLFAIFLQSITKKRIQIPYLPFITFAWLTSLLFKTLFPFATTLLFP